MSNGFTEDDVLPSAMTIARIAISEIVEKTIKSMEREYEREFKQRYNQEPNENDRLLVRKITFSR